LEEKSAGKGPLGRLGMDGSLILKYFLKRMGVNWINLLAPEFGI